MRVSSFAAAAVCLAVFMATTAGAGSLYAVRLADGASLAAVEDLGAVVRHVGLTEMIVEGDVTCSGWRSTAPSSSRVSLSM